MCLESEKGGVDHIKRKQLRHCKVFCQPGKEKVGKSKLWTAAATKKLGQVRVLKMKQDYFQLYKSLIQTRKKQWQRKEQLLCLPRIPGLSGWVFPWIPHTILHTRGDFSCFFKGPLWFWNFPTHSQKLAKPLD